MMFLCLLVILSYPCQFFDWENIMVSAISCRDGEGVCTQCKGGGTGRG